MYKIRPVKSEDLINCADIFLLAYKQPPWHYAWTRERAIQYLQEYFETKKFLGFVITENEEVAGAIFCHAKTWWTNDLLYVDELFISPARQGHGLGKQLLEHATLAGKQINLESISLMTNEYAPAFNFYLKQNYQKASQFVILFRQVD